MLRSNLIGDRTKEPEYICVTHCFYSTRIFSRGFRSGTNYGNWWSPTPPPMSKDEYRWQDDICHEWDHNLAFVSSCELKRHALVAIGLGQSACCSDGNFYPESNVIQMYIPGKSEVVKNSVENCQECRWPDCPWQELGFEVQRYENVH
jgi:hypothetical protein